jgi:AraC-like DNA-binding protein
VSAPRISVLPGTGLRLGRYAPDPGLAGHVDSYWTLDVECPPATVSVVADGLVDLTFQLGTSPAAWVTGPLPGSEVYRHERPVSLLGASLRPGAALPVLGVSVASLPAEWSPLSTVVGPVAAELAGRLAREPTTAQRLAVLDTFLAARLGATRADGRIGTAIGAVLATDGAVPVAALAREASTSPRNLGRLFDEWVGMSPKRFARIVRVQAVLRRLGGEPDADLARVAAELGFADQAHLTREVRALAGTTPGRLRESADSFKPGGFPGS